MPLIHKKPDSVFIQDFIIPTKNDSKSLSVYQGDIFKDNSDVIGINVYDHQGEMFQHFHQLHRNDYSAERKIIHGDKGWAGISTSSDQHVIFVHTDQKEGVIFTAEDLRSIVQLTFSALSAFMAEGNEIRTVALPVLFRKGIPVEIYQKFIHLYVFEAMQYVRKQTTMKGLKFYIWEEEDADIWRQVLSDKLVSPSGKEVGKDEIHKVKERLMAQLQTPSMQHLLPSWIRNILLRELSKPELDLEGLTRCADKTLYVLTDKICDLPQIPDQFKSMKLFPRLLGFKSERLLVEWLADYMLSLKTFQRHIRANEVGNMDVYYYLLLFFQILSHFELMFSLEGNDRL